MPASEPAELTLDSPDSAVIAHVHRILTADPRTGNTHLARFIGTARVERERRVLRVVWKRGPAAEASYTIAFDGTSLE